MHLRVGQGPKQQHGQGPYTPEGLHQQGHKEKSRADLAVGALLRAVPGSSCEPRSQCLPRSTRDSSRVDDGNVNHHELPGKDKEDNTLHHGWGGEGGTDTDHTNSKRSAQEPESKATRALVCTESSKQHQHRLW
jgi:hypothetical protein